MNIYARGWHGASSTHVRWDSAFLRRHYPDQVLGYDLSLSHPRHPCKVMSCHRKGRQISDHSNSWPLIIPNQSGALSPSFRVRPLRNEPVWCTFSVFPCQTGQKWTSLVHFLRLSVSDRSDAPPKQRLTYHWVVTDAELCPANCVSECIRPIVSVILSILKPCRLQRSW